MAASMGPSIWAPKLKSKVISLKKLSIVCSVKKSKVGCIYYYSSLILLLKKVPSHCGLPSFNAPGIHPPLRSPVLEPYRMNRDYKPGAVEMT